ncbi:Cation transporter family protein [Ancylostoma duodenale]|uniref:Cation transporter family protein n=1 Tax=Ancylostoma duodenale TaxID=51022 RepID=A0A0C2H0E4_9BILA|nr:Cation transporter family protein [Ancylostoma duodenale]
MSMESISHIDFVRMEYNLQVTFRQYWHDPRLEYSSMFGGKEVPEFLIITERDSIWIPDTFFLNEKRAHRHEIDKLNLMIRVHANGSVMYSERISLTLSCPMYIQNYPMDEQVCSLDLASYAFTTDDIGFYYMAQIYIPSSLLVIVSWVSFWLERTAVPARVTLGVTTLLTMTTQAAAINNSLPAVSYVKAVDVWVGACLAFIFAAVLEFAWVSYRGSLQSPFHSRKTATTEAVVRKRMSKKDSWGTAKHEETVPFGDMDDPLGSTPGLLTFWQKWKLNADPPKMIDLKSREYLIK